MRFSILYSIVALSIIAVSAQETPRISSFSPLDYDGANQNWSITQGCDDNIYVANTKGVLIFNGLRWKIVFLPNNYRPRSVFVGIDCKIYVSGYEAFGYVDMENPEEPYFQPIDKNLLLNRDQEYWKIFGNKQELYFQSFSELYRYDYQKIDAIDLPGNVMLGTSVEGSLILPKIESGVYTINGSQVVDEDMTIDLPEGSKVVGVVGEGIYATQNQGLFRKDSLVYTALNSPLNELLKRDQINAILKTRNGYYVMGTILNGIYISKDLFSIDYQINKANGLSNNTVLNLYEDKTGNIWCGLDKGLDMIHLNNPLRYYYDKKGELGTVFTSIEVDDQLYLGTNQGVFRQNKDGFQLIAGSQGQVWSLIELNGAIICGHNKGTFLIEEDAFRRISDITGGWCMRKVSDSKFLQSSYTGLVLFEKVSGQWNKGQRVENGDILLESFELFYNELVGFHPHLGIAHLTLNSDFSKVDETRVRSDIEIANPLLVLSEDGIMVMNQKDSVLIGLKSDKFLNVSGLIERSKLQRNYAHAVYDLNLTNPSANLNFNKPKELGSTYIVAFNEGYVTVPFDYRLDNENFFYLDYTLVNEDLLYRNPDKPLLLKPIQNDLLFQFRKNNFSSKPYVEEYQLEGWDRNWYPLPKNGLLRFANLQDGKYTLKTKRMGVVADFEIKPFWYESWPGGLIYLSTLLLILFLFNKRQNIRLQKQKEKLEAQKQKELESERIRSKNNELENEVLYKNKMLANSTMTLVQKNKMLIDLKATLSKELKNADPTRRRQILHLIELNINNDEDWELFESTFAEVHDDFLEKLKLQHPKITPGELKLAAYIKMDLSSKEIAPLMNISVRSIENKRYRLRKKLEIEDQSLKAYLHGL